MDKSQETMTEQLPSLTYRRKLTANNCKMSIKSLQKSAKTSLIKYYRNSFYKLLFKILKIWTNQAVTFSFCWNLQWLLGQTQEKLHIFFSSSFNFTKDSGFLDYFATNTSLFNDSTNLSKCFIYVQRITQNSPSFCTVKPY